MTSIPRILAVDSTEQIGGIVRGAMTLLDRRYILVEVPTAENALDELTNSEVHLMVTAYSLPDMTGLELAARAIRESAGTPIIILASPTDPEIDPASLTNAPYSYLVRPAGEQFWRALRIGLDGEAAVAVQEGASTTHSPLELGPIPEINIKTLRDQLIPMMGDTGAIGAVIADRMGRVVHTEGATGYFDKEALAAVLGPAFARTVDLRDLLGGNAWSLQYYDGENYDIFALALGLHYFVALIFDGTKRPAYGAVINYGPKRTEAIIDSLGDDAWAFRRSGAMVTQTMAAITPNQIEEAFHQQSDEVVQAVSEPELPPPAPELKLEPVGNMDFDALFNQKVDESSFDDLFTSEESGQAPSFLSGSNMVSFDEAINMGILDE